MLNPPIIKMKIQKEDLNSPSNSINWKKCDYKEKNSAHKKKNIPPIIIV